MEYEGTIREVIFMPMVEVVNSIMRLTVELANKLITTENMDSIENLSEKFEFDIIDDHTWDTRGMVGRDCVVEDTGNGYKFLKYID